MSECKSLCTFPRLTAVWVPPPLVMLASLLLTSAISAATTAENTGVEGWEAASNEPSAGVVNRTSCLRSSSRLPTPLPDIGTGQRPQRPEQDVGQAEKRSPGEAGQRWYH